MFKMFSKYEKKGEREDRAQEDIFVRDAPQVIQCTVGILSLQTKMCSKIRYHELHSRCVPWVRLPCQFTENT